MTPARETGNAFTRENCIQTHTEQSYFTQEHCGLNCRSEFEYFRMKILNIFMFYLISGPVGCFDVIGYPGGFLVIVCTSKMYGKSGNLYLCKINFHNCQDAMYAQTWDTSIYKERVSLDVITGGITVTIKQLELQDAGMYQCGELNGWAHNINLKVNPDPCCTEPITIRGYLGNTVTINCIYPEMFKQSYKYFYKTAGHSVTEMIRSTQSGKDRFSMSDNKSAKVVSVKISDVREADGGVYYCGVYHEGGPVSYYSLFTQIQLHVSEMIPTVEPASTSQNGSSVITVCVCVTLLLIRGLALLICKLIYMRTQVSTWLSNSLMMSRISEISHTGSDYEEIKDPKPRSDPGDTPHYSTSQLPTILSDPPNTVYVTAQLSTTPSHPSITVYTTAVPAVSPDGSTAGSPDHANTVDVTA